MKSSDRDKIGVFLLIGSFIFYFLIKLPFNLSVTCGNSNEGFYFVFGQHFLCGRHLYFDIFTARGPLFIMLYALIVKVFGFGTYAIIATHFIHTFMVILVGISIYLLSKKLFQSTFFSGFIVFLWILIQLTPTGGWGGILELNSAFALEAEYFCNLCSIFAMILLINAYSIQGKSRFTKQALLSSFAGLLTTISVMFKASGAVVGVAVGCWMIYLLLFDRKTFRELKISFFFFLLAFITTLFISIYGIYLHNGELKSFFDEYYQLGQYSTRPTQSLKMLFLSIKRFMFKYIQSYSNFALFSFTFLSYGWGLIRSFFIKENKLKNDVFWPLLSLWGIGNACAVIAPGTYGSYYYLLIWPSVAVFLMLGIKDLLINRIIKYAIPLVLILIFTQKIVELWPAYVILMKENIILNVFQQPESFEDPVKYVLSNAKNEKRPSYLRLADLINSLLPDKNDTVYVFNFTKGHQAFSPNIYIYSKRYPPTTIYSDWLHYTQFLDKSIKVLIRHMIQTPPRLIIVPKYFSMTHEEYEALQQFLQNFNSFVEKNYTLKHTFSYKPPYLDRLEVYKIYERKSI